MLSTALHACETWKSTAGIRNTLDVLTSSMYPEDPGTVVARSCHISGVDEKIGDASPIRDSANQEAEIGRPCTTIA